MARVTNYFSLAQKQISEPILFLMNNSDLKSYGSNVCWSICDACLQERKKFTTASPHIISNPANQLTLRLRSAQATKTLINV